MVENVTILIKTFLRKDCADYLIKSIRSRYPTVKIVVVDDSGYPVDFNYDENITTYSLPFDSGASAGRSYGVSKITTPYFVLVDDDFVFTDNTKLEVFVSMIEKTNLDILGGHVYNQGQVIDFFGNFHVDKKTNTVICKRETTDHGDYKVCQLITNFFIARTEKVKQYGWDNDLKIGEHSAFFFDHKRHLSVGVTHLVSIDHRHISGNEYKGFRNRAMEYFKIWLDKKKINSYTNFAGVVTKRSLV